MCIGRATHPPMRAQNSPPASFLTPPDTLLIFLCFESGDSAISAVLGDAEGYHPANQADLYRFSIPYPLQLFPLQLVSPRPVPVNCVQPNRCKTSVKLAARK